MAAKAAVVPAATGLLVCTEDTVTVVPKALLGWSLEAASAATVTIYDGASAGGIPLAIVDLVTGELAQTFMAPDPIEVLSGSIWCVVTGSPAGEIYWG